MPSRLLSVAIEVGAEDAKVWKGDAQGNALCRGNLHVFDEMLVSRMDTAIHVTLEEHIHAAVEYLV